MARTSRFVLLSLLALLAGGLARGATAAETPAPAAAAVPDAAPPPVPAGEGEVVATESAPAPKTFDITINPLGVLLGGLKVTFSGAVAPWLTIDVSPVYVAPLLVTAHAVGAEVRFTFWPYGVPFDGFFAGPWFQVSKTWPTDSLIDDAENLYGATVVAPGIYTGYRWLWESGFNMGLGVGGGWAFVVDDERPSCPAGFTCKYDTAGDGVMFTLLFDLGYAF